jgi:predicted branched-subunit amino acid permease
MWQEITARVRAVARRRGPAAFSRVCLSPRGRHELRAGLVDAGPLMVSVAAWGLTWGVLARQAGLWPWEVTLMSALMQAGTSQLVALSLLQAGAPAGLVLLAVYTVNLRHYLMAASLAPYVRHLPRWAQAVLAQGISDGAYALTVARWRERPVHLAYFMGCAGGIDGVWVVSSAVGAFCGSTIAHPTRYGLDFAFPAVLLALLRPLVTNGQALGVALVSGALALSVAAVLPGPWSILAAGLGGGLFGALLEPQGQEREP